MIGTAIRKFAQERGMTCDAGMAYGKVNGRYISMVDGQGTKVVRIYLYPPVEQGEEYAQRDADILAALTDCNLKEFRLHRKDAVSLCGGYAQLVFHDTIGTMKLIIRYIDEIMPKLDTIGLDTERCACCGKPFDGDLDYIRLDENIMPLHTGCIQQLSELVDTADAQSREGGSLAKGAAGALVGAVLGAIPWAIVFMLGYIAAIVGLLIGYLSAWMYDKFGGKKSKMKVVIVAVAMVIGVLLGQVAGYSLDFGREFIQEGGTSASGVSCGEYVIYVWENYMFSDQETSLRTEYRSILETLTEEELNNEDLMTEDEFVETYYDAEGDVLRAELRDEFVRNAAMGIFYGLLGCLGLFLNLHRQNKKRKVYNVK